MNKKKIITPSKSIDLITVNTISAQSGLKTLEYSQRNFNFNRVILFSHENPKGNEYEFVKIEKFENLIEYSNFMLKISTYLDSDYVLIVQDDGFIINSNKWTDNFLEYDYIGAPWPASRKWLNRWDKYGIEVSSQINQNIKHNRVGNGGFSLRSSKFIEYSATFDNCNGLSEDIYLTLYNYQLANEFGIKFPSFETALQFSNETPLGKILNKNEKKPLNLDVKNHFGWHGKKFKNSNELIDLKYQS